MRMIWTFCFQITKNRKQLGKGIYSYQLIQGMIGNAVTKIHAAKELCVNAGNYCKYGLRKYYFN